MRRELAPGRGRRSHDGGGPRQVAPPASPCTRTCSTAVPTAIALQEAAGNAAVVSRLRVVQCTPTVMFMLQSYGPVPPDMTRTEFEHAFTPLNPLRGADRGSMRVSDIMTRMPVILATFAAQADKPGCGFLKAYRAPGGAYTADAKGERWADATADLNGES